MSRLLIIGWISC